MSTALYEDKKTRGAFYVLCVAFLFTAILFPKLGGITNFRTLTHLSAIALVVLAVPMLGWKAYEGLNRFLLPFMIWTLAILLGVVANLGSYSELIQSIRFVVIMPLIVFTLGYICVRVNRDMVPIVFGLCGLVGVVLMYLSISNTPAGLRTPDGGWTGPRTRLYMHYLDATVWMNGPTVVGNCVGAFLCVFFAFYSKRTWVRIGITIVFIGGLYIAMRSGTRGLFIGTVLSLGMLLIALIFLRRISMKRWLLVAFSLLSVGTIFVAILDWESATMFNVQRFRISELMDRTATGRTIIWSDRIDAISVAPFGYGYGEVDGLFYYSSHSNILEIFYTFGWIAGVVYIIIMGVIFVRVIKVSVYERGSLFHTLVAFAVLAQLLVGLFESNIRSSHVSFFMFCFSVGCLYSPIPMRLVAHPFKRGFADLNNDDSLSITSGSVCRNRGPMRKNMNPRKLS